MKAIVLLSGGLDSTVTLAQMLERGFGCHCLVVDYGQRHRKEVEASVCIASHFDCTHEVVDLPPSLLRGSALTGFGEVPEGHYAEPSMQKTVVPARNLLLLSLAASIAVREGAEAVAYGAHAGDHAIYPDCRPEFVLAVREVFALCDYKRLDLEVPFLVRTKSDVVREGHRLGVPMHLTWTCYKGGDKHCGKCGSCVERKEAFALAGVPDPTEYQS